MNWKEEMRNYQQEIDQVRVLSAQETLLAYEKELVERKNKMLAALAQLKSEEILLRIRDDFWKLGGVKTTFLRPKSDDPNFVDYPTSVQNFIGRASLLAEWPIFVPKGEGQARGDDPRVQSWPDHLEIHREYLEIVVSEGTWGEIKGKLLISLRTSLFETSVIRVSVGWREMCKKSASKADHEFPPLDFASADVGQKLREYLLRESIERQNTNCLPYDVKKTASEEKIVELIMSGKFLPQGDQYAYLVEVARARGFKG